MSSQWSTIAGRIPVSGLAMGAYLTLLLAIFYIGADIEDSIRRQAWVAILVLAGALACAAIWFTIVQKWMIGQWCPYCLTEHTLGILMAAIIIERAAKAGYKVVLPVFVGLLFAGALVASQLLFAPKAIYQGDRLKTEIPSTSFSTGPIVGSANAPYMLKVLFDYNCPHCRKLHGMFDDIISKYKGKIAFILCPAPLSPQCNKYIPYQVDEYKSSCELAKIGMAIWLTDHKAFADFDKWMFAAEGNNEWQPHTAEQAKAKAIQLIGEEKFNKSLSSSWVDQYIQTCVNLYGQTIQTGGGGVPKLVFGEHWITPELTTADELISMMQQGLEVPTP